ncbi:MAG: hypothetical protein ACI9LY_002261 [Arenicella sp.]|jgi:hypothetical protein
MTNKTNDHAELKLNAQDVIAANLAFGYEVNLIGEYKATMTAQRQQLSKVSDVVQSGKASIYIDPSCSSTQIGAMISFLLIIAGGAPFTLREQIESRRMKTKEKTNEKIKELIDIKATTERKAQLVTLRNYATDMMRIFNIAPEKHELAIMLDVPEARDNAQAIYEWLLRESRSSKIDNDTYQTLCSKFEDRFEDRYGEY